mgnify:FL=1
MIVKGKLVKMMDAESGTSKAGKEWIKRNFIINNGSEYNPEVCCQVFGKEKVDALNDFQVGQELEVSINLSSREYNGKYYHNIDAWKIEVIEENHDNSPF